jgi:hypothetical protein
MFMSLKNYGCSVYVPPIGEELQIEDFGTSVSYHSDTYLLAKMSQLNLSQNLQDLIISRFKQINDSLPPELSEQVNKLSDAEKIKQTDSRYAQFLSDRTNNLKSLMKQFEDFSKEVEDKEQRELLDSANKSLRDFILRLSSPSSDSDKS